MSMNIKNRVDTIINIGCGRDGDPERAHDLEDTLLKEIIDHYCPPWVAAQIRRLNRADFPRWYA